MIQEHDTVVLTGDVPAHGLRAGDLGAVVMVHAKGGYEVEFLTVGGDTIAVVSLDASQVRPISPNEIAHVRTLETADSP